MRTHASRRVAAAMALVGIVAMGSWLWRPAQAVSADLPTGSMPRISDDGEKFVAFYGRLEKPLSMLETWRVLRGLRFELAKRTTARHVAGFIYYAGEDMYLAAVDFEADQVFIDRVSSNQAFSLIWQQVDADFSPNWSLRAPDRIESTDPSQGA